MKIKVERATEMTKAMLDLYRNESRVIVLHHRSPTSSNNKMSQTHPIVVDNGSLKHKYFVIHNGIINNSESVKIAHEALGFIYTTIGKKTKWSNSDEMEDCHNDSESLAIELARFIEKQTDTIGTVGSAAFIAIQADKKTDKAIGIFFGRNTPPLKLSAARGKIRLSSEGEGNEIAEDFLYRFNPAELGKPKFKIRKQKMEIKSSLYEKEECKWRENDKQAAVAGYQTETNTEKENEYFNRHEFLTDAAESSIDITGQILSEFYDKISDPTELMSMDVDTELKGTITQIMLEMRTAYNNNLNTTLNNEYEKADESAKEIISAVEEANKEKDMANSLTPTLPI